MIDNKNISILVFLPNLLVGGAEETTLKLVDYLAKHNYKVNLVVATNKISSVYEIPKNINYINLENKRLLTSFFQAYKVIKNLNPDLVFSTLWYSNLFVVFICSILGKKCVIREAGLDYRSGVGFSKKIFKLLSLLLYRRADKIIAISNSLKENLHEQLKIKNEKIQTIYNPVESYIDRKKLENINLKKYFQNTSDKTIIAISAIRFDEIKYSNNLFLAIKNIEEEDVRLLFVGEGHKRDDIKKFLVDNDIDDKVTLLDWQKNIHSFIYSSDLYVSSSKYEGLGNAYLAAQLLQKKCLSSKVPASLEINSIFRNGDSFKDEIEDMVNKIIYTIRQPEKISSLPKQTVSLFEEEFCFDKYCKIFSKVSN